MNTILLILCSIMLIVHFVRMYTKMPFYGNTSYDDLTKSVDKWFMIIYALVIIFIIVKINQHE